MLAAVRGDGLRPVNPRDALDVARVLEAAREAAAAGQTVRLTIGGDLPVAVS